MKKSNEVMDETKITNLVSKFADAYGVNQNDVSLDNVRYTVSGKLTMNTSNVSDIQMKTILQDLIEDKYSSIKNASVSVVVNDDNTITHTVTTPTIPSNVTDPLKKPEFVTNLNEALQSHSMKVEENVVDNEFETDFDITTNTSESTIDIENVTENIGDVINQGSSTEVRNKQNIRIQ